MVVHIPVKDSGHTQGNRWLCLIQEVSHGTAVSLEIISPAVYVACIHSAHFPMEDCRILG